MEGGESEKGEVLREKKEVQESRRERWTCLWTGGGSLVFKSVVV